MNDARTIQILVIDDENTHRILAKEYLEEAGYAVTLAEDGSRGLKLATRIVPDLVMVDLMIPGMDGYSFCKTLKSTAATAKVPVVLVTASREPDVIARGFEAGVDDFITKPIDWEFLADRVAHVLALARSRHAAPSRGASVQPAGFANGAKVPPVSRAEARASGESNAASRASNEADLQLLELRYAAQIEAQAGEAKATIDALEAAAEAEFEDERRCHAEETAALRAGLEAERRRADEAIAAADREARACLHAALEDAQSQHEAVQIQMMAEIKALRAEVEERTRSQKVTELAQRRAVEQELAGRILAVKAESEARLRDTRQEMQGAVHAELNALSTQYERQLEAARAAAGEQAETARRDVERQRLEAEAEAFAKARSCWSIARAMSHALSLNAKDLAGKVRALSEWAGADAITAQARGPLFEIESSAAAIASSLGRLRLLSQLMSGEAALDETAFDLARLVEQTPSHVKSLADVGKVAIRVSVPSRELSVTADESRIAYCLLSLTINAIQHSPHGSTVSIALVDRGADGIEIRIEDQGTGIAPAQLDALKRCLDDPAAAASQSRVGLGIPISTAIARLHGGRLELRSGIGRGTLASLLLPAARRRATVLRPFAATRA